MPNSCFYGELFDSDLTILDQARRKTTFPADVIDLSQHYFAFRSSLYPPDLMGGSAEVTNLTEEAEMI